MILYELLTGSHPPVMKNSSTNESQEKRPALPNYDQLSNDISYNKLLVAYKECTHLEPDKRPTPSKLLFSFEHHL